MYSSEPSEAGVTWTVTEWGAPGPAQPCGSPEAGPADNAPITRAGRPARLRASRLQRLPLPVLATDVVGYCRLIELDDVGTILRLRRLRRQVLEPSAAAHGGCIFRIAGDGTLVAFTDARLAVRCALAIHLAAARLDRRVPAELRLRLRMGLSLDHVIVGDDGDLHGRGVNLAARLEAHAAPGEILICGRILEQILGRIPVRCRAVGERHLKNMAEPVSVYSVRADDDVRP